MRQLVLALAIGIGGFLLANAIAIWLTELLVNRLPFTERQLYGITFAGPILFVLLMFRKASGEEISVRWAAEISLVAVFSMALVSLWVSNFAVATLAAFLLITLYPTARSAVARCFPLALKA